MSVELNAVYTDLWWYRCRALIDGDRCEADSKGDGGLCPEHEAMAEASDDATGAAA